MKRGLDMLMAALGLVLAAPLLLIAAIAIKLETSGAVLYRSERVGRGLEPFTLLKLRSMTSGEESLSQLTLKDDPRITRVGAVLQRFKFDEVPQLVNVLKGDMSIVGPRPESPEFVEACPDPFRTILSVRPGLTSPASLKYADESQALGSDPAAARAHYLEVVLPDKLRLDCEYVETRSLRSDLAIIGRTIKRIILG